MTITRTWGPRRQTQARATTPQPTVDAQTREEVLRIASAITGARHDPAAVVRNACPMLSWLEASSDDGDLVRRLIALDRMWCNLPDPDDRGPVLDAPCDFVAGAEIFYLFATSSPPADFTSEWRASDAVCAIETAQARTRTRGGEKQMKTIIRSIPIVAAAFVLGAMVASPAFPQTAQRAKEIEVGLVLVGAFVAWLVLCAMTGAFKRKPQPQQRATYAPARTRR